MKPIRFTQHALDRCKLRGATEDEVRDTILHGSREATKKNRILCRLNIVYNAEWEDTYYPIKQIAPVIIEEETEIVIITVYTFYF